MSNTQLEQQQNPSLPAKPETRRGVVTNPLVVSNARGDRNNQKQNGKKSKSGPSDGQQRKKKGGTASQNGNQSATSSGSQHTPNGQSGRQGNNQKGKRKGTNPNNSNNSENKDINKMLYPDMFDESGRRNPQPVTPKGDAYSGSSFHTAPAASSLPRPSFGASPVAPPPPPPPPPTWNGPPASGAPAGYGEMPQMQMPIHAPTPGPYAAQPGMIPQGYSPFGYYPPYGYGMPVNYNGYYYPPHGGVAGANGGE